MRVVRYQNSLKGTITKHEGNFCDGDIDDACDNTFIFCLRAAGTQTILTSEFCSLGMLKTNRVLVEDNAVFGAAGFQGLPNPFSFSGSSWPVCEG